MFANWKSILVFILVMSQVDCTKVPRGKCKKLCGDLLPGYRLVECRKSICLMKQISYNWREMPLPVPLPAEHVDDVLTKNEETSKHPCCEKFTSDESEHDVKYQQKCDEYREFKIEERLPIKPPVNLELDVSVLQLIDIEEARNRITLIFWVDMSFFDDRLKLCDCDPDDDNIDRPDSFVIGSKFAEKWWKPDLHIWENLGTNMIESVTNKRMKMSAKKFAGHTFVTRGFEMVVQTRCLFNTTKFPIYKNRCRLRFGSFAWNTSFIKFEMKQLRGEAVPREPGTSAEFYYLHDKDRFITVQRPKIENFTYDGFEVVIWRAAPIAEEFKVLEELQKFPLEIAIVMFIISGYPNQQERSGYIANIVSASIIYLVRIPTGMISLKQMNPNYWKMLTEALNTILAGFISFFVLVRLRADGILSIRDQRRLEFVVALCLVLFNFSQKLHTKALKEQTVITDTVVESKETCDNFVYDDKLY